MIGDVLASTVICEAIKREYPDVVIHYMIHPNTFPVVENNPNIDQIVIFDPKKIKGFTALRTFGKTLKKQEYDAIIDAYGKWESVIPAYFSDAKIRIGNKKWYTSLCYTKTVVPKKNVAGSAIHHRLQLAEALTGHFPTIDFPKIYLSDSEINHAQQSISTRLPAQLPIVMISVLGSDNSKSLPPKQMAETLDIIAGSGEVQLLFNFMPNQEKDAKAIYDLCQQKTQDKIMFDFYTKSLREFLAVLSQCNALIGNEGGAVNMAKALNIPTFTFFSPWINKSSWNMLNDDQTHVAVHLQDYFPEIYNHVHPKKFKKQATDLYQKFTPGLFAAPLRNFVKNIVKD